MIKKVSTLSNCKKNSNKFQNLTIKGVETSSDADILLIIGRMGRADSPVFVQQVQQRRFHRCPHCRRRQLPHFPLRRFRHLHRRRPHGPRARKERHRSRLRWSDFLK